VMNLIDYATTVKTLIIGFQVALTRAVGAS
jgi:hypothetical protein